MSETSDFSDEEFRTALAAAAYAIALLAEEGSPGPKRPSEEGSRRSQKESEKKKEDSIRRSSESIRISRWLSGKDADGGRRSPPGSNSTRKSTTLLQRLREDITDSEDSERKTKKAPTSSDEYRNDTGIANTKKPDKAIGATTTMKKRPTFSDTYLNDTGMADTKKPDKAIGATTTMKKRPTFSDTYLNDTGMTDTGMTDTKKPEKEIGTGPTVKKMPTFFDTYLNDTGSKKSESQKQELDAADSWEREEMAKIRKWHEKMNSTILQWENEKKARARRRKERKERELELRRARLQQEYRDEMSTIDKIAGGARKVSDERRRNDEFKTKEIARMISSSGKVPNTWFCICS